LEPDWFFLYLLPPIALEAGYFMPNKEVRRGFFNILIFGGFVDKTCGYFYFCGKFFILRAKIFCGQFFI